MFVSVPFWLWWSDADADNTSRGPLSQREMMMIILNLRDIMWCRVAFCDSFIPDQSTGSSFPQNDHHPLIHSFSLSLKSIMTDWELLVPLLSSNDGAMIWSLLFPEREREREFFEKKKIIYQMLSSCVHHFMDDDTFSKRRIKGE